MQYLAGFLAGRVRTSVVRTLRGVMTPFTAPAPTVIGHRGAPRLAPENTPAAFAAAAAAGATWVELDARRSADGVAVVHHDPVLGDGTPLCALPAAALVDRGAHRLDDVLDGLPPGLGVDVEVKHQPGEPDYDEEQAVVDAVVEVLGARAGRRPLVASAFDPLTVALLAERLPDVPAGLLHASTLTLAAALPYAQEAGARVLCPHVDAPDLDAAAVDAAHAAGFAVLVWTVDDARRALALAHAGVDAICTNEPGAIAAALAVRRPA